MNDAIKMTGRLLLFDKETYGRYIFPKDCEIAYAEKFLLFGSFDLMIQEVLWDLGML